MFDFILKEQQEPLKAIESILNLEKKYKIVFPDVLKNLYAKSEGGKIKLCVFKIDGFDYEVSSIISVVPEGFYFEKIADSDRDDGFLPVSFYPFASNRGGDIYYWDSETKKVYLSLADDIENPILISDSIEEFIILLEKSIRN